ncbi:MAG: hypothetical protein ABW196_02850 [Solirubrobacterales bacterium]
MRLIAAIRRRLRVAARAEDGYVMVAAVGAVTVLVTLSAVTLAASTGDLNLTRNDLDRKRAFAAAQAGVAEYSFHLNHDNSYWANCTEVPEPSAVNQVGSTEKRRKLSGGAGGEYAIEVLPATGYEECDPDDPVDTMLEQSGAASGTFRIRATGFAGKAKVSLVAAYKRSSLLDYIYFTQFETLDPVTYGDKDTIAHANTQCAKFRREGRESVNLTDYGKPCVRIVFVSGDKINGPLHTNDDLAICGTPQFGRSSNDVIEVSAPPVGWFDAKCSGYGTGAPKFLGPFVTTAPVLTPPATNGKLKTIAGASYTFSCQTTIKLAGSWMYVTTRTLSNQKMAYPPSGVLYVANGSCPDNGSQKWSSCSSAYSPFTATYPSGSDCGTVRVYGNYSSSLTIAADNDIIVMNDIEREGEAMLGLIANNFVRVWRPYPNQEEAGDCGSSSGSEANQNLQIDAAILALQHSFIVDHYDCGSSLGDLEVNGAISQKFRGTVGTTGGTGYIKDYNYDDRLRYMEPPNFLDPVQPSWHIQRETLDFPDVFG